MQKCVRRLALALAVIGSRSAEAQEAVVPTADSAEQLLQLADEVLATIEQQRGIEATAPIERAVQSREALRARLLGMLEEEYEPWELAATDRLLKALGVLSLDADYVDLTLDLLTEQVAGFYDQRQAIFYLLDDMDPAMQPGIMSHELFHALQDQRWGIEALRGRSSRVTDVSMARTAVIEGDALAVMIEYAMGGQMRPWEVPMLESLLSASMPAPAAQGPVGSVAIPKVVWDQLVFPYTGGLGLVVQVGRSGGWAEVNGLYGDMPDSTEQVLHPERYINRDEPTWLEFDVAAAIEGRRYAVDSFGELTTRSMLEQLLEGQVASSACGRAAAGWDGDRLEAWESGDDRDVLVWLSVWDTPDDASAFYAVAARLGSAWMSDAFGSGASGENGSATVWEGSEGVVWVERWGDMVLLVSDRGAGPGLGTDGVRAVIDRVWATHTRSAYPASL